MTRVGLIGCGNIAPVYTRTVAELDSVDLVAFADGMHERATKFGDRYGGTAMSVDELLGDPSVEIVLNLTPAQVHGQVTASILKAGKAAYSEKPLGADLSEGLALVQAARDAGLRLGCAPDTFFGASWQTARAAIDRGAIGEPLGANAFMLGFGPEWWHPNPEIFYAPGAGPLFDMGPYYLTALVNLLGPAASVSGAARVAVTERVVHTKGRVGDVVTATAPTHTSSIIEFAAGPIATLVTSFDVKASNYRNIEIYGTDATLSLPDPNHFGGAVKLRGLLHSDWQELPMASATIPQQRGVGLADMASAMVAGRPHRASAEMALHVLELMDGTLRSAAEGRRVVLTTTCERPAPLRTGLATNTFD